MRLNRPEKTRERGFTKYQERGAYHWCPWYRRSLHADARYGVATRLVRDATQADEATGIDVGCGDGRFLFHARQAGDVVFGLDESHEGLTLARTKLGEQGVWSSGLITGSVYELPFADGMLDYVVGLEFIEHLHEPRKFLSEMSRVLSADGTVVLSTPNRRVGQEEDEVRDPFHVKEYVAEELAEMVGWHFARVTIYGGNPEWLVNIVERFGGRSNLGRLWRLIMRSVCAVTVNPFEHYLSRDPDRSWERLYAVGSNPA